MGTGSTIFADESGDDSATDANRGVTEGERDDDERLTSIFRHRDDARADDGRQHGSGGGDETVSADEGDHGDGTDRTDGTDHGSPRRDEADTDRRRMLVYEDGDRSDFELDG